MIGVTRILCAPASPQYNAIEGCFSIIKNHFKRAHLNHLVNRKPFNISSQVGMAFKKLTVEHVNSRVDCSLRLLIYPNECRAIREGRMKGAAHKQ